MTKRSILHPLAILTCVVIVGAAVSRPENEAQTQPARYLYVWAGNGNDTTLGLDVITGPVSAGAGVFVADDSGAHQDHGIVCTCDRDDADGAVDCTSCDAH